MKNSILGDLWRALCDTALSLTTQSKLTVHAPAFGSGVPAISAVLGAMAAAHILVRCPVFGVGSLNGSLLGCFCKRRRAVSHCVWGLERERLGMLCQFSIRVEDWCVMLTRAENAPRALPSPRSVYKKLQYFT